MADTQRFIFEPEMHPPHAYHIGPAGFAYHPPGGGSRQVAWEAIRYLEDIPGRQVNLVAGDEAVPIPLYYGTRRFADLLAAVCARLAALHGDQLGGLHTFRGNRSYLAHSAAVLGVFAMLIFGSLVVLQGQLFVWLFLLAATLPMAVYILRQPHTVTPGESGLEVKDFLRTRFIPYAQITAIEFDLYGDRQTAYLCIRVKLVGGRRLTVLRLENLVLLYLVMTTRWRRYRAETASAAHA